MNKLEWIRLTSKYGRTHATFHREKSHKKRKISRKNRHRLNRALVPVKDQCAILIAGGLVADYYM